MRRTANIKSGHRRRGSAAAMTAISLTTIVGFTALAVDVSMLYDTRTELQRSADAAALAGAARLLDNSRLKEFTNPASTLSSVKTEADTYAGLNTVQKTSIKTYNGDVTTGYLANPDILTQALDTSTPSNYNSVHVYVARSGSKNGSVTLWFGQICGLKSVGLSASATATFKDGVVGYKVTDASGPANLLPLALHVDVWKALMNKLGTGAGPDNYSYSDTAGTVSAGADAIPELNLYPGSGVGQLPPGNFGTVNVGPSSNSTAHLSSQIRYGVTKDDLSYYGGELKLGSNGTLPLSGDTGLSAGISDDLISIIGQARAIPLFNNVSGNGNNSNFTIVGFAGIRVVHVDLTGSMDIKKVIIQPSFVVDDATITGSGSGSSYFVYQPVRLTR